MQTLAATPFDGIVPFALFGLFVLFFAFIIMWAVRQQRRAREGLAALGDRLGLSVVEVEKKPLWGVAMPHAVGTFRSRNLSVFTYSTGSGKHRVSWCAFTMHVRNAGGLTLNISKENFLTKAGRIFGVDDIKTGDAAFDEQFYVKTNDAGYVRAALIPEVRMRFIETFTKHGARGTLSVSGAELKYAETGSFSTKRLTDSFPSLVELAADVAEIVETHRTPGTQA